MKAIVRYRSGAKLSLFDFVLIYKFKKDLMKDDDPITRIIGLVL